MTFLNGKNIINPGASLLIYIQSNLPYFRTAGEWSLSTQAPTGVYAVSFNGVIQAYK